MGFQDVAFLLPKLHIYTIFIKYYGRGESLRIATCRKTMVWCKQAYAAYKILLLQQIFFLCHLDLM